MPVATLRTNGTAKPSNPKTMALVRFSAKAWRLNPSPARNIRYRIPMAPRSTTRLVRPSQPDMYGPNSMPKKISPSRPGIPKRSATIGPGSRHINLVSQESPSGPGQTIGQEPAVDGPSPAATPDPAASDDPLLEHEDVPLGTQVLQDLRPDGDRHLTQVGFAQQVHVGP